MYIPHFYQLVSCGNSQLTSNQDITGPSTATIGIIDIYDIFGISNQTIQGADLLAARLNALVLVPDFFHGERADLAWFPPDTEEKKQALFGFINTKASVAEKVGVLGKVAEDAKVKFASVKSWGAFGLCWGGKVSITYFSNGYCLGK